MAASTAVTTRSYPKRKRAEISYHESSPDQSEEDDGYDTQDDNLSVPTKKKLKTSRTTVSTKPLPKRKIFPFTSLPAELKNQIYALTLTDANGIFLVSKTKRYRRTVQRSVHFKRRTDYCHSGRYASYGSSQSSVISADTALPAALVPNILLLNQAIYAETQPILYAGNTFAVEDTTAMHAFLAIIGPKNRATITDLTIRGWGYTKAHKALNHPAFTMLAGAVNLTRLHLDCQIGWASDDGKRKAKQLYRDGFHWLEAMGVAKGKFDAAVDIIEHSDMFLTSHSYRQTKRPEDSPEEKMKELRAELRRLLS